MSVKLIDFSDPAVRLDPYPEYRRMRDQNPVAFDEGRNTWYVFRYSDVKTVITDSANFSNDTSSLIGAPPTPLIHFDPPGHTKQRALINKAFSPKMIAALDQRISVITERLLDRVVGSGQLEMVHDFSSPLPVSVITEMMGVPEKDHARVKHWADQMAIMSNSLVTGKPPVFDDIMQMLQYLSALVLQRKETPGDDLISALWQAEVDGQSLDMGEILGFCVVLYFGGTESTSNLLTTSVATLLRHPEILAEVRKNPALIPAVTDEMLRYRAPSQAVYRMARRDVELGGQLIKSGQFVVPLIGSANHDESIFTNPDQFDIRRQPNPQLGFGHGIHFCLGAALTRMEARVGLGALLGRLPELTLDEPGPLEPLESYFFYGYTRLRLRFAPTVATTSTQ
jgi:cytochrome P450